MILLKNNRTTRTDDINAFNKLRKTFADITDKHANQRKDSTLRSSIGNRVHFKPDILADDSNRLNNQYYNNNNANNSGLSALGQPKNQSNQNDYNNNGNVNNSAISALVSGVVGQSKNQLNQNDYNNNNNNNNVNTGAISALVSSVAGKTKSQSNQNTNYKRDDNRKLDERYKNIHFKMFIDNGCRENTGKCIFKMFIYYYKLLG